MDAHVEGAAPGLGLPALDGGKAPRLTNQRLFESLGSLWHGKADLARYEILHRFGGVYIDADAECIRPLDEVLLDCEAFACFENEQVRPGIIANGFMGAVAGSRVTGALIDVIGRHVAIADRPPWQATGPVLLTGVAAGLESSALTVYPSHYFLPTHYSGATYRGGGPIYAVHHWSTTEAEELARLAARPALRLRRWLERTTRTWTRGLATKRVRGDPRL